MDVRTYLSQCLGKVLEMKGQDLFLKVGSVPRTRAGGMVQTLPFDEVRAADTQAIVDALLNPHQKQLLAKNLSVDFAFSLLDATQRFRVNVFYQMGTLSLVIRTLWKSIPTFEALKIPPVMKEIALSRSGIILIA